MRVRPPNAAKPVPCSFGLMAHPLELAACPSNDIGIDPLGSGRCERIEGTTSGKDVARIVARLRRGWVGAYVTLGAFSEVTQREVIDDEYPILLVPGRRVAQEIDRAAREAGLGGLKACLEAIDATYDKLVINRRPEEILRE